MAPAPALDIAAIPSPVLITGGAGFIGRYLAEALARAGKAVTVLDDLSCKNSTFDCPQIRRAQARCVEGSVFDEALMAAEVAAHRTVVHFASVVGVEETISRPFDTIDNLRGTMHLARLLTADHVALFASSADVYALHSHMYDRPMREDDLIVLERPEVNRWVYAHVKALEENLIANAAARSVVIRVFNTYGPMMDYPAAKRVIPHFMANIMAGEPMRLSGDGSQQRSFCYVEDTVGGMMLALAEAAQAAPDAAKPFAACYNLGASQPMSMRALAEYMNAAAVRLGLIEAPLPIEADAFTYSQKFDDSWHRVPDIGRARERLGFAPTTAFDVGMERTLAYYRDLARSQAQAAA
ncbi:MAG: NAD-dependent epimerase/dehydratase family protein [Alphaproteobacteria bacterium]